MVSVILVAPMSKQPLEMCGAKADVILRLALGRDCTVQARLLHVFVVQVQGVASLVGSRAEGNKGHEHQHLVGARLFQFRPRSRLLLPIFLTSYVPSYSRNISMGKKVAIVGSGVSGIGTLWALQSTDHEVHLYEAGNRLGGHTNTVTFEGLGGQKTNVDTGFIVFNTATYRQSQLTLESFSRSLLTSQSHQLLQTCWG